MENSRLLLGTARTSRRCRAAIPFPAAPSLFFRRRPNRDVRPHLIELALRNSRDGQQVVHALERPALFAKFHNFLRSDWPDARQFLELAHRRRVQVDRMRRQFLFSGGRKRKCQEQCRAAAQRKLEQTSVTDHDSQFHHFNQSSTHRLKNTQTRTAMAISKRRRIVVNGLPLTQLRHNNRAHAQTNSAAPKQAAEIQIDNLWAKLSRGK